MPFTTVDGNGFPVPVLAQISKNKFEICVPFKYRRDDASQWVTVPKDDSSRETDLASVPGFLLWLVPRYGAHTLAALVHDQLVDDPPDGGRIMADTIFRDALGELRTPWIRRWMMWAAVSLGTTWKSGLFGILRVVPWGIGLAIAAAFLWQRLFSTFTALDPWPSWFIFGQSTAQDLAVIAGLGLFFLPRLGLGWLAGAALLFVFPASVAVLATTLAYLILEIVARGGLWLYNTIANLITVTPVTNVPVVMSRTEVAPDQATPRGCPELVVPAPPDSDQSNKEADS